MELNRLYGDIRARSDDGVVLVLEGFTQKEVNLDAGVGEVLELADAIFRGFHGGSDVNEG